MGKVIKADFNPRAKDQAEYDELIKASGHQFHEIRLKYEVIEQAIKGDFTLEKMMFDVEDLENACFTWKCTLIKIEQLADRLDKQ